MIMMISAVGFETLHQTASMSSRELAEMAGTSHAEVKRLIKSLETTGRVSQPMAVAEYQRDGQRYQEYQLNQRDSLTVIARLSPAFTPMVLDHWQERELMHDLPDFTNPAVAARAWAVEYERRQAAERQVAAIGSKADFFDRYVTVNGAMGFRQVCKLLQAKETDFRHLLLERHIMYRLAGVLTPYQQHLDAGRFEVHTGTSQRSHTFSQARFTAKGVKWIAELWATHAAAQKKNAAA
ncbi:phage antirepressor YoqD-like protein [Biostraticola tofi]|uniref:Phage antirepressor YoqD-like protein n=2 Tax=Biostraticola tofi TaxID=466109 RepID=A0A4R3Z463_9GAMM|nr:phage antirepressor YoqD-like protein [Biostraticola tofi]